MYVYMCVYVDVYLCVCVCVCVCGGGIRLASDGNQDIIPHTPAHGLEAKLSRLIWLYKMVINNCIALHLYRVILKPQTSVPWLRLFSTGLSPQRRGFETQTNLSGIFSG
jgi:hypothetical protein